MPSATQPKKHICDICKEGFTSKTGQKKHRRDMHTNPQKQPEHLPVRKSPGTDGKKHICDICQEGFTSKSDQKRHRRDKHTNPPQQPEHLPVRKSTGADSKKHICGVCQVGFGSKLAQKDHRRAKHTAPQPLPRINVPVQLNLKRNNHICDTCEQFFVSDSAKKQHYLAKHAPPQANQSLAEPSVAPSFAPSDILIYRSILYSSLSVTEQAIVRSNLAGFCHSEQRLKKEGYKIPKGVMENENSTTFSATQSVPCSIQGIHVPKRVAIVLDCEMAGALGGQDELVQITILDFLTGEILLNSLVNPSRPIEKWREDITGIDDASMAEAVLKNQALHGWEAARTELWRFANAETIIIGQSVYHDLEVLHTFHLRIIDTAIVTAQAVLGNTSERIKKRWGLQTLCQELLGIQIRAPLQLSHGKGSHDALEDSFATRELTLLCIREPEKLKRWARAAKAAFHKGNGKKPKAARAGSSRRPQQHVIMEESDDWGSSDEEILRWEDVIDWEMWPKSPPDSD